MNFQAFFCKHCGQLNDMQQEPLSPSTVKGDDDIEKSLKELIPDGNFIKTPMGYVQIGEKLSPRTVKAGDILTGGREVTQLADELFYYTYKNLHLCLMHFEEANDLGFKVEKKELGKAQRAIACGDTVYSDDVK